MAKRRVEHNRVLLCYWMMRGGMNPLEAWKASGQRIKRSLAQINRKKKAQKTQQESLVDGTYIGGN